MVADIAFDTPLMTCNPPSTIPYAQRAGSTNGPTTGINVAAVIKPIIPNVFAVCFKLKSPFSSVNIFVKNLTAPFPIFFNAPKKPIEPSSLPSAGVVVLLLKLSTAVC